MVGGSYQARSVIYFPLAFGGWKAINSATLYLRGSKSGASHCSGDSSSKTMYVRASVKDWGEDVSETEGLWGNRTWDWTTLSAPTTAHQATKSFPSGITDGTWYSVDVTDLVRDWFSSVRPNYGFVLVNSKESASDSSDALEFYAREKGSAYRPYIVIDYSTNTAPNAPTGLYPTGDAVVPSLTPTLSGNFSDPDAGDTMSAYQILAYEDDGTTLIWDSGSISVVAASSFSVTYAGSALSYNTFYKWKVRTRDAAGLWGPYSTLQRFQTVDATPPDAITGLSATVNESSITLDWDESTLAALDFDHYEVYRREVGDTEWTGIASIYVEATVSFDDISVSTGIVYEYKVTQFKNVVGGFDIESADSDIVQAGLEGDAVDAWIIVGADGLPEHTFEINVMSGPSTEPIQQESFEPLGSNRKTIARGRVLGAEGTLNCFADVSEVTALLPKIRYITRNRGPHVLRSPFGDVWLVEFSGVTKNYIQAGHLEWSIAYTEVA